MRVAVRDYLWCERQRLLKMNITLLCCCDFCKFVRVISSFLLIKCYVKIMLYQNNINLTCYAREALEISSTILAAVWTIGKAEYVDINHTIASDMILTTDTILFQTNLCRFYLHSKLVSLYRLLCQATDKWFCLIATFWTRLE